MQQAATELLHIEVLRVKIEPGDTGEQQKVCVMALVNQVTRTSSNIKTGDLIHVIYTITSREKGWVGPREIPILGEKEKTIAYLVRDPVRETYYPAAGVMSFQNFLLSGHPRHLVSQTF